MTTLANSIVRPLQQGGMAVLHELQNITHPLVHAVEQPIENVWQETKEMVHTSAHWLRLGTHVVVYSAAAWLLWTSFGAFFPSERYALERSLDRARKRMRLD